MNLPISHIKIKGYHSFIKDKTNSVMVQVDTNQIRLRNPAGASPAAGNPVEEIGSQTQRHNNHKDFIYY
ncbi:hypothetical protein ZOSMA_74G01020 [Zostera marina]|uniref:Uncharacterized protein n=1 Tax=Zostera marina TaxID=29655 RepID=A0A0K9NQ71_ZOSMR|nr:hypothetical protein ZOSMA_74G01020 [Zostera marina]